MQNRNYIKKPITDESRECKLSECKIMFEPTRRDRVYCCIRHCNIAASRDYRAAHRHDKDPRIQIPRRNQARACRDFIRRDTPQAWMAYMEKNPGYAAMVCRGQSLVDCCNSMSWT